MFAVDPVHAQGIDEDQRHEDVDRPLLREPESEMEAGELDAVESIGKEDSEAVGNDEPHGETGVHKLKGRAPISVPRFGVWVTHSLVSPFET